jgi:hypothetical protein
LLAKGFDGVENLLEVAAEDEKIPSKLGGYLSAECCQGDGFHDFA